MISPILLYGAPTYPETPQRYNKLRGTCTRMLRSALNLPFDAHATLSDLYGRGFVEKDNATHDLPQLTTDSTKRASWPTSTTPRSTSTKT